MMMIWQPELVAEANLRGSFGNELQRTLMAN